MLAEKSAWKDRGKAELQVRLGAQFGQRPTGELAAEEQAEAFPKHQTTAAAAHVRTRALCQIKQVKQALPLGEALHHQFESAGRGRFDCSDPASEVTGTIPSLQKQPA